MKIIKLIDPIVRLFISKKDEGCCLTYNRYSHEVTFEDESDLQKLIFRNIYQLQSILKSKPVESFYKGFQLDFVITDQKQSEAFRILENILVVDRLLGGYEVSVLKQSERLLPEVYTDGSYLEKKKQGGYAIVFKSVGGGYNLHTFRSKRIQNTLIELEAAIKGLSIYRSCTAIRLITDSQYVRKGISEWLPNWKLNNWTIASGEKVKNVNVWKELDQVTENRYIEVKYVKAHSQQFENTMADLYAREIAGK